MFEAWQASQPAVSPHTGVLPTPPLKPSLWQLMLSQLS